MSDEKARSGRECDGERLARSSSALVEPRVPRYTTVAREQGGGRSVPRNHSSGLNRSGLVVGRFHDPTIRSGRDGVNLRLAFAGSFQQTLRRLLDRYLDTGSDRDGHRTDGGLTPEEVARRHVTEKKLGELADEWGGVRCGLCDQHLALDSDDPHGSWDDHVREVHVDQ